MTQGLFLLEDYQRIKYKIADGNSFYLSKPMCKSGLQYL